MKPTDGTAALKQADMMRGAEGRYLRELVYNARKRNTPMAWRDVRMALKIAREISARQLGGEIK